MAVTASRVVKYRRWGPKPRWSLLQSWQGRLLAVRSLHVPAPFSSSAPLPPAVRAGAVCVADDGQHGLGEGGLLRAGGDARHGAETRGRTGTSAAPPPFG